MNEEETELARDLVALPGWSWPLGMVAVDRDGARWVVYAIAGYPIGVSLYDRRARPETTAITTGSIPDLHHPATAGVLLAMLAATGRLTCVYPPGVDNDWRVDLRYQQAATGPTLGVACARALVALGAA